MYNYIKDLLFGFILISILLILDFIFPNISPVISHPFEYMTLTVSLGITFGIILSLNNIKKYFKKKE